MALVFVFQGTPQLRAIPIMNYCIKGIDDADIFSMFMTRRNGVPRPRAPQRLHSWSDFVREGGAIDYRDREYLKSSNSH
ncbi:hypothetical protein F4809DRAFT_587634 [Biscogniauxia mediterranea]|nr:hypothetical protein F4809DRAFT_587634 [Biscogniauxia mediterranea]